jgi:hypothetical protein
MAHSWGPQQCKLLLTAWSTAKGGKRRDLNEPLVQQDTDPPNASEVQAYGVICYVFQ